VLAAVSCEAAEPALTESLSEAHHWYGSSAPSAGGGWMTDPLRDEFDAFFVEEGGIASAEFVDTFPRGSLYNEVRDRGQAESQEVSSALAAGHVELVVHFDVIASPELNAVAATPRAGVAFVAITLGTLVRTRILVEVLLSQAHTDVLVLDADTLLRLIRDDASFEEQWAFLRDADARSFIVDDAFVPEFPEIPWSYAVDFVYGHELNHVMLGHADYAARQLRLDRMDEGEIAGEEGEEKLRLLEMRADIASGKMLGNRIPNKRFMIYPAVLALGLSVSELMGHAALGMTTIMSGFNIAWDYDPSAKLYRPGTHPHPDFRFRIASDGVKLGLRGFPDGERYEGDWYFSGGYGNSHCKRAYAKILGVEHEMALQPGPVFYIPAPGRPGPHPHTFSTDAEIMYKEQLEAMRTIDREMNVIGYAE
jgi:hypothetical protein